MLPLTFAGEKSQLRMHKLNEPHFIVRWTLRDPTCKYNHVITIVTSHHSATFELIVEQFWTSKRTWKCDIHYLPPLKFFGFLLVVHLGNLQDPQKEVSLLELSHQDILRKRQWRCHLCQLQTETFPRTPSWWAVVSILFRKARGDSWDGWDVVCRIYIWRANLASNAW